MLQSASPDSARQQAQRRIKGILLAAAAVLAAAASAALGAHQPQLQASYAAVEATGCGGTDVASSFAVDDDLLISTAHSLAGKQKIVVTAANGLQRNGYVVGFDAERDIAAVRVPSLAASPVRLAEGDLSEASASGSAGVVVSVRPDGFLLEKPYEVLRRVRAEVDNLYFTGKSYRRALQLKFSGAPGDSGAAVLGKNEEVVGMVFATSQDRLGTGYAIRSVEIAEFLDGLGRRPLRSDCR